MSQRGGSVVTYVRYGEKVYSPIIDKGEADFILSFELLEAARWTEYLKEGGSSADQYAEGQPHAGHYRRGGVPEGAGEKACGASHPPRRDGRAGACAAERARPRPLILCCWADSAGISTLRTSSGRTRLRRASRQNSSNSTRKPLRSARRHKHKENPWNGIIRRKSNAPAGSRSGHGRTSGSSVRCVMCGTMCPITAQRWRRRTLRRTISRAGTIFTSCRF